MPRDFGFVLIKAQDHHRFTSFLFSHPQCPTIEHSNSLGTLWPWSERLLLAGELDKGKESSEFKERDGW